jgi:ABC-type transport system involved in multi-copper enzyme maturation permease subunit
MRWGPGPVFVYECIADSRRWQFYAARAFVVSALLIGMSAIWWGHVGSRPIVSIRAMAGLGEYYFYALIGVELALVMLAAPAATAGTICVDRARGTLAQLLMTDLSDAEIVLGKLGARLLPVFGLVAGSWPVLALGALLGGLDPSALVQALGVVLAVAVFGCAMALALSVWARKPHEVIMACYTVWGLALLGYPLLGLTMNAWGVKSPPPQVLLLANPFYVAYAPYVVPPGLSLAAYGGFLATCLGGGLLLVVLATVRVRRVATRGEGRAPRAWGLLAAGDLLARALRRLPGPSLDGNPVLWREWHRTRPSKVMTIVLFIVVLPMCAACLWDAVRLTIWGIAKFGPSAGILSYVLLVLFGLLMFSAVAPMSLSEERQRGSLDVLMATPLSTRQIVVGKWLGTYRLVAIVLLCPALVGLAMGAADNSLWLASFNTANRLYFEKDQLLRSERFWGGVTLAAGLLAHGALVTSLGLLLATWIKRQGRAIALSVTLFLVLAAGWPFLVFSVGQPLLTAPRPALTQEALERYATLSPYALAVAMPDYLGMGMSRGRTVIQWAMSWDIAVAVLALILLEVTVRTFDRCLGRVGPGVVPRKAGSGRRVPIPEGALVGE